MYVCVRTCVYVCVCVVSEIILWHMCRGAEVSDQVVRVGSLVLPCGCSESNSEPQACVTNVLFTEASR